MRTSIRGETMGYSTQVKGFALGRSPMNFFIAIGGKVVLFMVSNAFIYICANVSFDCFCFLSKMGDGHKQKEKK